MTPYQEAGFNELSLFVTKNWGVEHEARNGSIVHLAKDDGSGSPFFRDASGKRTCQCIGLHLAELPKDEDGFYLHTGGECPVPGDWEVEVKYDCPRESDWAIRAVASTFAWFPESHVCAFKPISRPDMPSVAQSATDETSSATEGQLPRTAEQFLHQAAELMAERGKEYDKPSGERSMGNAVVAFNAITGRDLSEHEGWLLMSLVKRVRQYSTPNYHKDSAEDAVAYAALEAEALEGEQ